MQNTGIVSMKISKDFLCKSYRWFMEFFTLMQQHQSRQQQRRQCKADKVRQDKARQGKARQGKIRQGKIRQDKTRQDKARQGNARQCKARQGKARQGKTWQGKARVAINWERDSFLQSHYHKTSSNVCNQCILRPLTCYYWSKPHGDGHEVLIRKVFPEVMLDCTAPPDHVIEQKRYCYTHQSSVLHHKSLVPRSITGKRLKRLGLGHI